MNSKVNPSLKCLMAACLSATALMSGTGDLMADVLFGYRNTPPCANSADSSIEFSRKGRFFATSDFADTGADWGAFTRARNNTLPTYTEPWIGRIDDLRAFAVPYRLLPFVEPASYAGKLSDSASQAVIKRYGERHGLVNAGNKDTVVELELPAGSTAVTDLSDGVPQKLETLKNKDGKQSVKIAMKPWSLKTLEIK